MIRKQLTILLHIFFLSFVSCSLKCNNVSQNQNVSIKNELWQAPNGAPFQKALSISIRIIDVMTFFITKITNI